jgi:hypothetical protein
LPGIWGGVEQSIGCHPAGALSPCLGVEDPPRQISELVDLLGAQVREEPPLQSSEVIFLRVGELLDSLRRGDFSRATYRRWAAHGAQMARFDELQ